MRFGWMRFSGRGRSRALMTGLRGSVAAASAVDSALCTEAAEGATHTTRHTELRLGERIPSRKAVASAAKVLARSTLRSFSISRLSHVLFL